MKKQSKSMLISDNEIDHDGYSFNPDIDPDLNPDPIPKRMDRYYTDPEGIKRCVKGNREINNSDPDLCDDYNIILSDDYQRKIEPTTIAINISLYYKQMNPRSNRSTIDSIREMMLRLLLYPNRRLEFGISSKKFRRYGTRLLILEEYNIIKYLIGWGSLNRGSSRKSAIYLHPDFDRNKWLTVPDK